MDEYPELAIDALAFVRAYLAGDELAMATLAEQAAPELLLGVSALAIRYGIQCCGSREELDRMLGWILGAASADRASQGEET